MIENKFAHGAPASFGAGVGAGAGAVSPPPMPPTQDMYADDGAYYGAYSQPSFVPGQIVSMAPVHPGQTMSPPPMHPGQVMSPPPMHPGQTMSPPPMNPFYAHAPGAYGAEGLPFDNLAASGQMLARQPSTGSAQVLTRQPSVGSAQVLTRQPSAGSNAYLTRQPSFGANQVPGMMTPGMGQAQAQYVDLSRSSVTPFQAVQYAEISRRLNTAPPGPLPLPTSDAALNMTVTEQEEDVQYADGNVRPLDLGQAVNPQQILAPSDHGHALPESPFADPHARVQGPPQSPVMATLPAHDQIVDKDDDVLLQPPQRTLSGRSRVPSIPPTLPQLSIHERPFSPVSYEFPSSSGAPKPSPLAAEVTQEMPAVPPAAHTTNASVASGARREPAGGKRPDTVYTVYDDEDAYGGI